MQKYWIDFNLLRKEKDESDVTEVPVYLSSIVNVALISKQDKIKKLEKELKELQHEYDILEEKYSILKIEKNNEF